MNKLGSYPMPVDGKFLRSVWTTQRVWLTTATILGILLIFNPQQGIASAWFTAEALIGTAPFLLLSIALAAYAGASGADSLIARAFVGSPSAMIVCAAMLTGSRQTTCKKSLLMQDSLKQPSSLLPIQISMMFVSGNLLQQPKCQSVATRP